MRSNRNLVLAEVLQAVLQRSDTFLDRRRHSGASQRNRWEMKMTPQSSSRRRFLSIMAGGVGAAALGRGQTARAAPSELAWLTWDANAKPQYAVPFEKATGVKLKLSYLTSDDAQFAALKAGARSDYDVVNPSINGAWRYIEGKVLKPLDLSKLPGRAMMYPAFKDTDRVKGKDGQTYAVPYLWGLNPIVYRADKLPGEPDYGTLFDAKYKGQLAMRDYALEALAIAGLYVGIPRERVFTMTDAELAEAKKALVVQKPLLRTYWQTIGDLTNLFATGEVTCAFSWRVPYDVLRDKMKMGMAKPKAGIIGWCDCAALPVGLADDKLEIAYKLIDYLLGPDYATEIAMDGNYATSSSVIRDKLSPEKREQIFIDDLAITDNLLWPVAPPNYPTWLKIWNEVKAS
jgi:spermidine/putrescine transport system substrate-binding protein